VKQRGRQSYPLLGDSGPSPPVSIPRFSLGQVEGIELLNPVIRWCTPCLWRHEVTGARYLGVMSVLNSAHEPPVDIANYEVCTRVCIRDVHDLSLGNTREAADGQCGGSQSPRYQGVGTCIVQTQQRSPNFSPTTGEGQDFVRFYRQFSRRHCSRDLKKPIQRVALASRGVTFLLLANSGVQRNITEPDRRRSCHQFMTVNDRFTLNM